MLVQFVWAALFACSVGAVTPIGHPIAASAARPPLTLWHRIASYSLDPDSQPAWWRRGVVAFEGDLATFQEYHQAWNSLAKDGDVYQIGYLFQEQRGNVMPEITSFVSVNECHLHTLSSSPLNEVITINMHSPSSKHPIHLAYSVPSTDLHRCQAGQRAASFNTTVQIAYSESPEGPILPKPIVVHYEADGTVKAPEPEKSFIQKYWMYMVPVLLLALTAGGGDERR